MTSRAPFTTASIGLIWFSHFCFGDIPRGVTDADNDGEVSLSEFQAYAEQRLPNFDGKQLGELARRVDVDSDGKISVGEFAARMAKVREMVEAEVEAEVEVEAETEAAVEAIAGSDAEVLLITSAELRDAWGAFAEWKSAGGKETKIVTVAQIEKGYQADTVQEKIRLCVREHIEKRGTRWLVLGGDCLPGGKGHVPGGHTTVHRQEAKGIPTDVVYLSKTDWDADGDGVYGEWEDDREAISYPDGSVGLGRVPVRTVEDVKSFTDKVIAYESDYPEGEFATEMVYTCTDQPAYAKVRMSWDVHVGKVWTGGAVKRFFSEETSWDEEGEKGAHDLSAENLVSLINGRKAGKLHLHGHGLIDRWVLEGHSMFVAEHVDALSNEGFYPLVTTVSCNTGEYDNQKDPSIVERMIRRASGGSVAVVAPIRTGKPHFHDPRRDFPLMMREGKLDGTTLTMTRYWENGLGSDLTTGHAIMKAKAAMAEDARQTAGYHLCICELNLLGDPTLDMRARSPKTPGCELVWSAGKLTVKTGRAGAQVCLRGGSIRRVLVADAEGLAVFESEGLDKAQLKVGVSGASLNTVVKRVSARP